MNSFFLIDFGYAKQFTNNNIYDIRNVNDIISSLKHYNIRVDNSYQGTATFLAIQKSEGYEPSPKIDLEELIYSLIYLFKNGLPWSHIKLKTHADTCKKICNIKKILKLMYYLKIYQKNLYIFIKIF